MSDPKRLEFESTVYDFGAIEPGSKHLAVWEFDGDPATIEQDLGKSCGCTSATLEGNTIKAVYDAPTAEGTIRQTVFVYYKDGRPRRTKDTKTNRLLPNPHKMVDMLQLSGVVVAKKE